MGKKVTITLDSDMLAFIKETAHELKTQNNRHTDTPIFRIYEMKQVETRDGCGEVLERLDYEGADEHWCKTCKEIWAESDWDYEKLPEIGEDGCNCDVLDDAHWTYDEKLLPADDGAYSGVAFLTEKAAQEYLENNSYHFNKGVVYAESAFRNWELKGTIKLFEELGEQL